MAKKNNTGKGDTHGFGSMEVITPPNPPADPGGRDLNDPTWVKRDADYKERGTPRIQYS